jgi:hypothetical protein
MAGYLTLDLPRRTKMPAWRVESQRKATPNRDDFSLKIVHQL